MKKIIGGMLIITALLSLSAPILSAKDDMFLAPDFTLEDTAGNKITLSNYKNKQPVLLFFWTTWCPFCRKALGELNGRFADLEKKDLKIMVINTGEPISRVGNYIKNNPFVFSVFLDTDSSVAYIYEILGVPTYILISKDGRVVFKDNYFPSHYEGLV